MTPEQRQTVKQIRRRFERLPRTTDIRFLLARLNEQEAQLKVARERERLYREVLMLIEHAPKGEVRDAAVRLKLGGPTINALAKGYRSTHREASAYRGALTTTYRAVATEILNAIPAPSSS